MVSALFSIIILVRIHENVKIPCISALPHNRQLLQNLQQLSLTGKSINIQKTSPPK